MENINQDQLRKANAISDGQQFFISIWCELLNMDTIDSYRVRTMNANLILTELEHAIHDRIVDDISLNNILFICREAEKLIGSDKICTDYYKNESKYVLNLLKNIQSNKKDEELLLLEYKIKVLKKLLNDNYLSLILENLKKAIDENNLNNINLLSRSLTTELIQIGYSIEYLYFLKIQFLAKEENKDFNSKWIEFVKSINGSKTKYNVHFKFNCNKILQGYENLFDIKIFSSYQNKKPLEVENQFISQPGMFYGLIENIESLDHYSAIINSTKKIEIIQNLMRYEFRKTEFDISPYFLVENITSKEFQSRNSYQRPIGFISSGRKKRFDDYLKFFKDIKLDEYSIERISNSFKYFRMSLDSDDIEVRFVLCWVALEFLLKTGTHSNIISRILYYLPKIHSLQFFKKLLIDFSSNLNRMNVPAIILEEFFKKKYGLVDIESIYNVLLDKDKVKQLSEKLVNNHLKFRLNELSEIFNNQDNLNRRFLQHYDNIVWNIQRIYRIRNKIVHSAATGFNIRQVEGNLTYYFSTLFNNIIYTAANSSTNLSIESILNEYDSKSDYVFSLIKSGDFNFETLISTNIDL